MRVLFIGDIVGATGRDAVRNFLKENPFNSFDFIIANVENSAGGIGLVPSVAEELLNSGINILTSGNHWFEKKEVFQIVNSRNFLRPANYPSIVEGHGYEIFNVKDKKIIVINLMGRVYMPVIDCPFRCFDLIYEKIKNITKIIIVDFHAEITSEKEAFAWYLNGRASAVIGTHTHVQTADEQILPEGTAYITDVGFCGAKNSVIGNDINSSIKRFLTGIHQRLDVAKGEKIFNGVILEIDPTTGKTTSLSRIMKFYK